MRKTEQRLKILSASDRAFELDELKQKAAKELLTAFATRMSALGLGVERPFDGSAVFRFGGAAITIGYSTQRGVIGIRPTNDSSRLYDVSVEFDGENWVSTDVDLERAPIPGEPLPLKSALDVLSEAMCDLYDGKVS